MFHPYLLKMQTNNKCSGFLRFPFDQLSYMLSYGTKVILYVMSACVILVYSIFQYILFPLIKEIGDFTLNAPANYRYLQSRGQK